jgi:hypothetical protein
MKSIRKFAYAALVTLSAFTFTPTLVAAEEARGSFTLTHDVRWQNIDVSAGEYRFSLQPTGGVSQLLLLRKADGSGGGLLILVNNAEASVSSDLARIVLVSRSGKSYVSAMEVPQSGVLLHFVVPPETAEKKVAAASPVAAVSSTR